MACTFNILQMDIDNVATWRAGRSLSTCAFSATAPRIPRRLSNTLPMRHLGWGLRARRVRWGAVGISQNTSKCDMTGSGPLMVGQGRLRSCFGQGRHFASRSMAHASAALLLALSALLAWTGELRAQCGGAELCRDDERRHAGRCQYIAARRDHLRQRQSRHDHHIRRSQTRPSR